MLESNKSSYTILENLNSQLHQQINKAVETTFVEYEKNISNIYYYFVLPLVYYV